MFYTDAAYWDQQDGGMFALLGTKLSHTLQYLAAIFFFFARADFDEKCSKEDDWDVDMSGYYDSGRLTKSYTVFMQYRLNNLSRHAFC